MDLTIIPQSYQHTEVLSETVMADLYLVACNLGSATSVSAELWGFVLGLGLVRDYPCDSVFVEPDSEVVVQMIQKRMTNLLPLKLLLGEALSIIDEADGRIRVNHIYREANKSSDFMANLDHSGNF